MISTAGPIMNVRYTLGCLVFLLLAASCCLQAQERVAPIQYNPFVRPQLTESSLRTAKISALGLPFFEDFDQYDIIPDTNKWLGRQVYINNTMCVNPVSRGCASFDAISQYGVPYDTVNPYTLRYADSLTSKPIDLSSYTAGDSIYLSFLYQPGGNGFLPDRFDSLMLYFRPKSGGIWKKVWSVRDTVMREFRQVMIPVTDTAYLHAEFQFRFVNKASVAINDDVWNIDYVRLNDRRTLYDTLLNDIAFVEDPGSLLNDYTSMPYRQFIAAPAKERASSIETAIRNNFTGTKSLAQTGFAATDALGASLSAASTGGKIISGRSNVNLSTPSYTALPTYGYYTPVTFYQQFWLEATTGDNNRNNDTIVKPQFFDNYLAYDDGTAEMSYYLNLFPTLPGKIAIEHHLNQPDTLKGMAIYFGRQVPSASYKYVNLVVYEQIAYGSAVSDKILYQLDNIQPRYKDTVNHFWIYKFEKPVPLPAGTFYIGTTQPALSGSDSLYIGLDRNRKGANHAYFNVLGVWNPSLVEGALMIRPLLGQDIVGSSIEEYSTNRLQAGSLMLHPNPARDEVRISTPLALPCYFTLRDLSGKLAISGTINTSHPQIDLKNLSPGTYWLSVYPPNALPLSAQIQKQ